MANAPSDVDGHGLNELRCLHELARQILPLTSTKDVARDGLLCIAGITGIGCGALWWRDEPAGAFELLAAFGLESAGVRPALRWPAAALRSLVQAGPIGFEAARRRSALRPALAPIAASASRMGDAWVLVLGSEMGAQGMLLLGPSLVTGKLVEPQAWVADLADVLRLGLVGSATQASGRAHVVRGRGTRRSTVARLAALRRAHPETGMLAGESPATLALLEELVALADTDYTVLLEGETGTGKELAAQLLHRLGRRARGPFEAVDCSAIPTELIESELFGHVKGAFTGAARDFRGAFERADGGTLLLDEIGDMDLRSQTRLLRVLQEGHVRPVGGDRPVRVDVRVVAASHRDLAARVRAGSFREDLYYRIHVCWLRLPPLRERGEDRLLLFERGLEAQARALGRAPRPLTPASRRRLRTELFPGNIRQLQNVVQQLLARRSARGPIELEELQVVLERSAAIATARAVEVTQEESPRDGGDSQADDGEVPLAAVAGAIPPGAKPARSGDPVRALAPAEVALALDPHAAAVSDVGTWVVDQLRGHGFNLRAAALRLSRLRQLGATRAVVPVFDRGALDYHLCGEFMRRLTAHAFDVEGTLADLAGRPDWVPRLRRKVRAYLRPLAESSPDAPRIEHRFSRLPERYKDDVRNALAAWAAGRWKVP